MSVFCLGGGILGFFRLFFIVKSLGNKPSPFDFCLFVFFFGGGEVGQPA